MFGETRSLLLTRNVEIRYFPENCFILVQNCSNGKMIPEEIELQNRNM